jgi:hypothetical protein
MSDVRSPLLLSAHKDAAPSCGFAATAPGEDAMAKINELLLLTCMGAFIASATYAVTLLH